jgi:HD-GYP domain-containing protein (c-di-GMP phosphodiesterase class II)
MNGLGLAKTVIESHPKTRMILVSGYLSIVEQLSIFNLGVEKVFSKPWDIESVIEAIENPPKKDLRTVKDMIAVKISEIMKRGVAPFDLFLPIGAAENLRLDKVLEKGKKIEKTEFQKFLDSGLSLVFAQKADCLKVSFKMYVPLRLSILKQMKKIPFALYHETDIQFTKISEENADQNAEFIAKLSTLGAKRVFIEDKDEIKLQQLLDQILGAFLNDANISAVDKAGAVSDSINKKMENVLQNPTEENIEAIAKSQKNLQSYLEQEVGSLGELMKINHKMKGLHIHSTMVASIAFGIILQIQKMRKTPDAHAKIRALDEYSFDSNDVREIIFIGALFHDLGKPFLQLTGASNEEVEMKHAQVGYDRLVEVKGVPKKSLEIILQHDEFCDGSGYPKKLTKTNIGFYSQVVSLANFYEHLQREKELMHNAAMKEINQNIHLFNKYLVIVLEELF